MSNIFIVKDSVTKLPIDCVVNAANEGLWAGGGVCGVIFAEAGHEQLTRACRAIGRCETGGAVITPGFDLRAKHIIHAVGPIWNDGKRNEAELLYSAYYNSLKLAKKNKISSIGFPLISSGIFGYPKEQAWERGLSACLDFITKNADYDFDIYFAVLDDAALQLGQNVLERLSTQFSEAKKKISQKSSTVRSREQGAGKDG